MSKPIPTKLLFHSGVLYKYSESELDSWGKRIYTGAPIPLSRIRIQPTSRTVKTTNNIEVTLTSLLFHDERNSRPAGFIYELEDRIEFEGTTYHVKSIDRLPDNRGWHHWEVGLV